MTAHGKKIAAGALAALLLTLSACGSAPQGEVPQTQSPQQAPGVRAATLSTRHTAVIEQSTDDKRPQYTQADYAILKGMQPENYLKMTLADYNEKMFSPGDETAFHKTEEALHRLFCSLPETDPLYLFLDTTVSRSWEQCSRAHYNACAQRKGLSDGGTAMYERYEDVFGDKVLVAEACAGFWYEFTIPDEKAITVGERDQFIQKLNDGMQAFMDRQSEADLKQEKTMETALLKELQRLTGEVGSDKIYATTCGLDYDYEEMWD